MSTEVTLESLAREGAALRGRVQELEDRKEIHRLTRGRRLAAVGRINFPEPFDRLGCELVRG